MNIALAREIYGGCIWAVDCFTFTALSNALIDYRNGVVSDLNAERLNSFHYLGVQSGSVISGPRTLNSKSSEQLINVVNINGPITKNGGSSSFGMKEIADAMMMADADPNVIGHLFLIDSGGGATSAMRLMRNRMAQLTKPKASVIDEEGVAGSAAYGIAAKSDRIFAASKSVQVGSIGTMISFKANPNKSIDSNGAKQVTIYASASTMKNKWVEEALNNDNYELAISEVLDPSNNDFMAGVKADRPGVLDTQLNGSVYNAGDVIGSLVDEIGGMDSAIKYIKKESKNKLTINNNNKAMTAAEFKLAHPASYQEIFSAGVTAGVEKEADRVGSWMAHSKTDLDIVSKGIESGKEMTATATQLLLIKGNSRATLETIKTDSTGKIITPESTTEVKTADQLELEAAEKALDELLKA